MSNWPPGDPPTTLGYRDAAHTLRNLVTAENKFLTSLQSLSKDAESVADAWRALDEMGGGKHWQDAIHASTSLLMLYAGALEQQALQGYRAQPDLGSIQLREEKVMQSEEQSRKSRAELYSLEAHLEATRGTVPSHDPNRLAQLERRDDLDLNIAIVESAIESERENLKADREATVMKWMSLKFAGLRELSEKGVVVGEFGQRIVLSTPELPYEYGGSTPGSLLDEAFNRWVQLKDPQLSEPRQPVAVRQTPVLSPRPPARQLTRPSTPLRVDVRPHTPQPQPTAPTQPPGNPIRFPVPSTLPANAGGRRPSFNRDRRPSNASRQEHHSATDDLLSPFLPILGRKASISDSPRTPAIAADYLEPQTVPAITIVDHSPAPSSGTADDQVDTLEKTLPTKMSEDIVKPAPEINGDSVPNIDITSEDGKVSQETSPCTSASEEATTNIIPEQELSTSSGAMVNGTIAGSTITSGGNVSISTAGRDVYVYNGVKDMNQEELDLLNWVSKTDSKAVQWSILEEVTPGTGTWFLNSARYDEWVNSEKTMLWGVGKPGAGKTFLSSIIINALEERAKKDPSTTVIHVHCRYPERFTTTQVFAALLRQLAENSKTVFADVRDKLYTPATRPGRPRVLTLKQMLDALVAGLRTFSKTYLVVDALDELGPQVRHDVVGILEKRFRMPILLTSRLTDLPHGRSPDFEIRAPSSDIHAFVRHNVGSSGRLGTVLSRRQDSESILNEVAEKIEEVSDGMFLMAALHVDNLKGVVTIEALREAVDRLPQKTIDEMYQAILERVDDQPEEMKRLAYKAIGWVIYSFRPLKLQELVEALAVEPGCTNVDWDDGLVQLDILIATCCGLLTFERATGAIRFIHVTVHHFFEERSGLLEEVFYPSPHSYIAEVCASYMKIVLGMERLPQDTLKALFSNRAFLDHACRYVGSYIHLTSSQDVDSSGGSDEIQVHQYVPEPLRRLSSIPLLTSIKSSNIDLGSLAHLGALSGVVFLLRWRVSSTTNVNEESEEGMTPLFYAAIGGHVACVEQLLQEKEMNVHHKAKNGTTALLTAILFDQKQAQGILLRDHQARERSRN